MANKRMVPLRRWAVVNKYSRLVCCSAYKRTMQSLLGPGERLARVIITELPRKGK